MEKLHESGRIWLASGGRQGRNCTFTDDFIDSDEYRIRIQLLTDELDELQRDEPWISLSIGGVDETIARLRGRKEFGTEHIEWGGETTDAGLGAECPICTEDEFDGEGSHIGVKQVYGHLAGEYVLYGHVAAVHGGCVDELADAIENVWDYSDELLADMI